MTRSAEGPPVAEADRPDVPARAGRLGRASRVALAVVVAAAAVALMVRLSIWQWDRGRQRGSLLNYSYAVEWMLFAVLTVLGLIRLGREGTRTAGPAERPAGRHAPMVGPPLRAGEELPEVTWVRLCRRLGLGPRS